MLSVDSTLSGDRGDDGRIGLWEGWAGDGRPLLAAGSLALIAAGAFAWFLAITDQLLPHDLVWLSITPAALRAIADGRLVHFMGHDRAAFGGTLIAIGMLYLWLVRFPLAQRARWAWWHPRRERRRRVPQLPVLSRNGIPRQLARPRDAGAPSALYRRLVADPRGSRPGLRQSPRRPERGGRSGVDRALAAPAHRRRDGRRRPDDHHDRRPRRVRTTGPRVHRPRSCRARCHRPPPRAADRPRPRRLRWWSGDDGAGRPCRRLVRSPVAGPVAGAPRSRASPGSAPRSAFTA